MAKGDVKIVDTGGQGTIPTKTFLVEDRGTSSDTQILPGEPVKIYNAEGGNYVTHVADGEPAIGTDIVVGIAASTSTETDSADGEVEVYLPVPGLIMRCAASSSSNLGSGVKLDTVTFDYSNSTYTVDEDEGSDEDVHGLRIIDVDSDAGTVDFMFKTNATILGDSVA